MRILPSLLTALVLSTTSLVAGCASEADQTSDTADEASAAGSFDLWQATDSQWHFHLKSGNGAILMTSEAYEDRTSAINGVLSTLTNGVDEAQYELAPAAHGFLLHLKAGNGQIIGFTEVYATKSSATRAIASCVKATTSYLDKAEAAQSGAHVEIAQGTTGQFHFNVHAKNGATILSSESYTTEAAAYNGALAVQSAAVDAANFEIKQNTAGGFYFTLSADNGEIVGTSQQYTTKAKAQSGIKSVQTTIKSIKVI